MKEKETNKDLIEQLAALLSTATESQLSAVYAFARGLLL